MKNLQILLFFVFLLSNYLLKAQPLWGNSEICTINPYCIQDSDRSLMARSTVLLYYDHDGDGIPEDNRTGVWIAQVNDLKNYILTAAHGINPIVKQGDYLKWDLILYGIDYCNGIQDRIKLPGEKVILKEIAVAGDFLIIELIGDFSPDGIGPLWQYDIYKMGWSISNKQPTNVKSFHHPRADKLSVSYFNNPVRTLDGSLPVLQFDVVDGHLDLGSSGGPVIDQNKRIIALNIKWDVLTIPACSNYTSYHFLTHELSSQWCELKQYLDPTNTGAIAMDGKDAFVGTEPNPDQTYYKPKIVGTTNLCIGDAATYELKDYPLNVVHSNNKINWNPINSFTRNLSGTNNEIAEYTAGSGTSKDYTITAEFQFCDSYKSYSKDIWVGAPDISTTSIQPGGFYTPLPGCIYYYDERYSVEISTWPDGATSSSWSGLVSYLYQDSYHTASFYPVDNNPPYYGSGYIQFTASNSCGNSVTSIGYGPCSYTYSVSPNPADSYLEVSFENDDDNDNFNSTTSSRDRKEIQYEIMLFNKDQEMVKYLTTKSKTNVINIKDLSEGSYYLNISDGNQLYQNVIEIKR